MFDSDETLQDNRSGFQRRYGLDVQEQAIRLRRLGRSWLEVSREVGVSTSQIKRWVWAKEQGEGKREQGPREIAVARRGFLPGYMPERPFDELCTFYEARLQRIASILERTGGDVKDQIAALKGAAEVHWRAFQIMKDRAQGAGNGDEDLAKYQKHLDGQLSKAKEKLGAIKRAQKDAQVAEPIELTVERVEDEPQPNTTQPRSSKGGA
jgi:hypothetical protein